MASYTDRYNLKKPDDNEQYDVGDQNGNMDKIETALCNKVDTNQGAANAGKFLIVDGTGAVVPTTVPFANGVSF